MSFTNKYFIYLLPFVLHYNISCTSTRVNVLALSYTPDFSKKLFLSNLKNLENKANKNPFDASLLFNASKELTIFSYAYTMEEAARLKISDYSASKTIYLKAHNDFVRSIDYINSSLDLEYPSYKTWIVQKNQKKLDFKKVSVEKLYWAAGAYAGAIQSSNGDPKWVIQLPKIGQLLESGMKLDPEWNYGSFYTAMISYTLIRHDAKNNKFDLAKEFFERAVDISKGQDLSPYISYAVNIAVSEQDRNEFTNMLYKALNIDIYANPELTLSNYMNRKKANWLLDNIDEYFY